MGKNNIINPFDKEGVVVSFFKSLAFLLFIIALLVAFHLIRSLDSYSLISFFPAFIIIFISFALYAIGEIVYQLRIQTYLLQNISLKLDIVNKDNIN